MNTHLQPFPTVVQLLQQFSTIGLKNETGIERLALSDADKEAREMLDALFLASGLYSHHDRIGNQFGFVYPPDRNLPLVLVGSHLDSQPDGGRFDGQMGVLAGLSVVLRLREEDRIPTGINLGVANWTNEEGARFQPSVMGSSVFTSLLNLDEALSAVDEDSVSVAGELERIGAVGKSDLDIQLAGYAELHVEQGGALEDEEVNIGIVEGTWAAYKADVTAYGIQTHTGPTAMKRRVDALYAASQVISAVHEAGLQEPGGLLHTAVAWMRITPNSPNATPSKVEFKVELRSPNEDLLSTVRIKLDQCISRVTENTGVEFDVGPWSERPASSFDDQIVSSLDTAISDVGLTVKRMLTIAGHDAVVLNSAKVPTALLFVPSQNGITHNAGEYTSDADMENGENALMIAVGYLCQRVVNERCS